MSGSELEFTFDLTETTTQTSTLTTTAIKLAEAAVHSHTTQTILGPLVILALVAGLVYFAIRAQKKDQSVGDTEFELLEYSQEV